MKNSNKGKLVMASNAIGNNTDIPLRSLEYVRTADLLVFEEDKPARQVLKTAGVHRDYLKFSEHLQTDTLDSVREHLKNAKTVCYMSDQGVPTLADPGKHLLDIANDLNSQIEVIPGPSSITSALAACSFLTPRFYYLGFLPREDENREKLLRGLIDFPDCMVILDTPYRLKSLISSLKSIFPNNRKVLVARDISLETEEYISKKLDKLDSETFPDKKNFVLVIEGKNRNPSSTTFEKKDQNKKPVKKRVRRR